MAFVWCVRRSASNFSSVCGRLRSISAVFNRPSLPRNPSPLTPLVARGFLYSTAIDQLSSEQTLLRLIDSEISFALLTDDQDLLNYLQFLDEGVAPWNSPWRMYEDNPGHQTVTLTRFYNAEHVKVVVSKPTLVTDENDEDDDDDDCPDSSIPLVVTVTKPTGVSLEFSCMAFPYEIAIDALSVKHPADSLEDQMPNEGPDFQDLDENLKKTFHEFLEIRVEGITTYFFYECMMRKIKRENLLWLKNVKEFLEN